MCIYHDCNGKRRVEKPEVQISHFYYFIQLKFSFYYPMLPGITCFYS